MLGLWKEILKGKEEKGQAVFSSFGGKEAKDGALLPASYRNCDCRGGILRAGVGLKKYLGENGEHLAMTMDVNSAVRHTFFVTLNADGAQVNTQAVYLVGVDGYLYQRQEDGSSSQKVYLGNNVSQFAMKGENKVIYNFFCGENSVYVTVNGSDFKMISTIDNVGACICKKRCLILSKNGDLLYTSPLNPLEASGNDPDGVGTIYLPVKYGAPVGIKEYKGKVYLFFERGICKLSVSAKATENTLEEVGYHGGNICLRGQAVTSKGILFLASEGAYYLRNDHVERVCEHLPIGPCAAGMRCGVGYCDDLVIFSYFRERAGGTEAKRIVLYADGKDGYFTESYGALSGNAYTYVSGKFYTFSKDGEGILRNQQAYFLSEELFPAETKRKRLKRLILKGEGSVTVGVQCGVSERKYPLVFQGGVVKMRLLDRGKAFALRFYLGEGAFVSGVEIEYLTGV